MRRRALLSTVVGTVASTAGCGDVDTQPDSVPLNVNNQAGEPLDIGVEVREKSEREPLISTIITVDPGTEESVYAKPIREDGEYTVSIVLNDKTTEKSISGGGLRSVTVNVYSAENIEIRRVDT